MSDHTKKKTIKVETLLEEKNWTEARQRLQKVTSPTRVGELLYHIADKEQVPPDFFTLLFSRLSGKRTDQEYQNLAIDYSFWKQVCNTKQKRDNKSFAEVAFKQKKASFQIILNEVVQVVGPLTAQDAQDAIFKMWRGYFAGFQNSAHRVRNNNCNQDRAKYLLGLTSSKSLMKDLSHKTDKESRILYNLWSNTELLIASTDKNGLEKRDDYLVLHRMLYWVKDRVYTGSSCEKTFHSPTELIWLALKMRPEQLTAKDDHGRMPIHWAVSRPRNLLSKGKFYVNFPEELKSIFSKSNGELVLEALPESATFIDAKGKFPIMILLAQEQWNNADTDDYTVRLVKTLIQEAPDTLQQKDPESLLLPFMAAAAIGGPKLNRMNAWTNIRRHTLIYTILREAPAVVACGIHSPKELILMRQLEEAQRKIKALEEKNRMLEAALKRGKNQDEINATSDNQSPAKRRKLS